MAIAVALILSLLLQATPQELIEQLRAEKIQDRTAAQKQLAALGKAAVPDLERAAKDPDLEIARRAAIILRQIELQDVLTPAVLRAVPNAAELLASGTDQTYTQVMLKVYGARKFQRADLEPLALPALRGAEAKDKRQILSLIQGFNLASTKPELLRIAREPADLNGDYVIQILAKVDPEGIRPLLFEMLRHSKVELRLRGLRGLQQLPAPDAAPQIVALLGDPEPSVRLNVVLSLESLKAVEQLPRVVAAIRDKDRSVSIYAGRAIVNMDAVQTAPLLLPLLDDPEPHVRVTVIQTLEQLRIRTAAAPIVDRLKDKATEVRAAAAFALTDLRVPVDAAALRPLLKDEDADTQKAGLWALELLGGRPADDDLAALLVHDDGELRLLAAWCAGRHPEAKVGPALLKVLSGPASLELPHAAVAAGRLGLKEALPSLLQLGAGNGIAAAPATEAAAQLADASTLPALLALLESDNVDAAEGIAPAFRRLQPAGIVDQVAEKMNKEPFRDRRISFLGALKDPRASVPLMKILKDPQEPARTRAMAALALGRIGHQDAVPDILDFVKNTRNAEGARAVQALVLLDARSVLPELRKMTGHGGELEAALIRAFEALGDTELLNAYAAKLDDLGRPADLAAAGWLSRAGRAEGFRWIMDEREGMNAINALRNPEAWKKLRSVAFPGGVEGTPLEILQRVASESGLALEFRRQDATPEFTEELRRFRIPDPGTPLRGDEILEAWMKLLDDDYEVLLEGSTLRVLPANRVHAILRDWWRGHPLNKDR